MQQRQRQRRIPSILLRILGPFLQLAILLASYAFHLTVLSQHVLALPVELWRGGISCIGYDSLVGTLICGGWWWRWRQQERLGLPWKLPMDDDNDNDQDGVNDLITTDESNALATATGGGDDQEQKQQSSPAAASFRNNTVPWSLLRFRVTFLAAAFLLVMTYFSTGKLSLFWEDVLYEQSAAGWPLTAARMRSLQVLFGHLSWVAAGSIILWLVPRPPSFFASFARADADDGVSSQRRQRKRNNRNENSYRWFRASSPFSSMYNNHWLWWTIGGYFVSSWLFNVADTINYWILPAEVLREAAQAESVVTQLVRPEYNDVAALVAGYLAPCVSAPVWEEVLYRGFLLAGLQTVTRSWTAAAAVQAVVFSVHHMSVTGALPLAVLGWAWAVLYTQSRNLWTVVAVHALWNSRVFLGSWLGL